MSESSQEKLKPLEPLKGDDRQRMGRLFEEITGKAQEMTAIMNRLHGTPFAGQASASLRLLGLQVRAPMAPA
jgi:hypothetical protein